MRCDIVHLLPYYLNLGSSTRPVIVMIVGQLQSGSYMEVKGSNVAIPRQAKHVSGIDHLDSIYIDQQDRRSIHRSSCRPQDKKLPKCD